MQANDKKQGPSLQRRNCKARVKSGCRTCKARRIKCDEGKPECRKCLSTGRFCEGYGIWGSGTLQRIHKQQQPQPLASSLLGRTALGPQDSIHYKLLIFRYLPKIAGLYPSPFWDGLVVQAFHADAAVSHAVLTLGTTFAAAAGFWTESHGEASMAPGDKTLSLHHYQKTIQSLRPHFDSTSRSSTRVVLICCLIFVCVEYLQGRFASGIRHLQNGLKLLRETMTMRQMLYEDLVLSITFQKLREQFGLFKSSTPLETALVTPLGQMPPSFGSFPEAYTYLQRCVETAKRLANVDGSQEGGCWPSLVQQKGEAEGALTLWAAAYEALPLPSEEQIMSLLMHHMIQSVFHMAYVMTYTSLTFDEMIYDGYDDQFRNILYHFDALRAAMGSPAFKKTPFHHTTNVPPFTLGDGLAQAVMYTALKCRDSSIRREALLRLNSKPNRQGIYDSGMIQKLVRRVVDIEQGKRTQRDDGIGEAEAAAASERRIRDLEVTWPDDPRGVLDFSYRSFTRGAWRTQYESLDLAKRVV